MKEPLRTATRLAVLLILALPAMVTGQAQYEQPPEGDGPYVRHPEAAKAIKQLKSPYCPGFMLEVCSSGGGAALRDSIETLADQGWQSDSIVAWVLANHGDTLLALPPARGKALVAWVVPPLAVAVGVGLVVFALLRMRRARSVGETAPELTQEDEATLREALRDLEAEEEAPFP